MARYKVSHKTVYTYESPVTVSHHLAHVKPLSNYRQICRQFSIAVSPLPYRITDMMDYFGNTVHYFSVQELHAKLSVEVAALVDVSPGVQISPAATPTVADTIGFISQNRTPEVNMAFQYTFPSARIPLEMSLVDFTQGFLAPHVPLLQGVIDLASYIFREFTFDAVNTHVDATVMDTFQKRSGVCQDFSHFMIACLRSIGLPASYVSGYILTYPKEGEKKLIGADATHAWVSVFIPQYGWVDIDPTNNKLCGDEHIEVARGRDYNDVSPLRGVIQGGGNHQIQIGVSVEPVVG